MRAVELRDFHVRRPGICLAASLAVLGALLCCTPASWGQQVNVGGGPSGVNSSFYENFGVRWGLSGRGWFFNFGGPPVPQFGGFDPGAQAQFGAGFGGNGVNGFFGLTAGQGANTTFGSQTGSVTVMNGQGGAIFDGRLTPFVTGVVPVVGALPPADPSPLSEKLARLEAARQANSAAAAARDAELEVAPPLPGEPPAPAAPPPASAPAGGGALANGKSTANQGARSLQAIRAELAAEGAEKAQELADLLAQAEAAAAAGKSALARNFFQQAWKRAEGAQKNEIARRVQQLPR